MTTNRAMREERSDVLQPDPQVAVVVDRDIAVAASNALTWYRAVPANTIYVTVRDGWVTLTGTVSQISQRGAAERAVRNLRGIRGISNAIVVSHAPDEEETWRP